MHANEVIEIYVDDAVRLLPKRHREDVAAELRALLRDELIARAAQSGRPADEALALSLVRAYGRPTEVAARYQPPLTLIEPADTRSFFRAALVEPPRSACSVRSEFNRRRSRGPPTICSHFRS